VHAELPEVTCLVNPMNLGYAAGVNVGLRHALRRGADFVIIVDNDATIAPDTIRLMRDTAHANPKAGLLTPKILYYSMPKVIWCAGHRRRAFTLAPIDGSMNQPETSLTGGPRPIDYAPCCGLLIRRSVMEQVGLLEERFFIYYEDLDFCIRSREAGFDLLNVPEARVWHKVAASAGEGSPLQKYYLARSSVYFYFRHTPRKHRPLIALYRLGSATRTIIRALRHEKPQVASAYLRGLRDGVAEVFGKSNIVREKRLR
jgi:hypothetical protein